MKILLANKFYYRRGGACIYTLNLEQLLKAHGHEVAVYSMHYPDNHPSEWSGYWPSNMRKQDALFRPFGVLQVKKGFSRLLDDFKPDVVHLNNVHTQLSPVIAEIAHQRGIKVVWTLHDYKLLCPRYDCLQNGLSACEACFNDKKAVLEYACMKNSKAASIIAYLEAKKWNRERIEKAADMFICPSQFIADKMVQGGFDQSKLKVLCNFIDVEKCKRESYTKDNYYCFIGRLSHEKGVKTLIDAANRLPYILNVIGDGPLMEELRAIARPNIVFVGFRQWDEIKKLVGKAKFSVIPSEWYENNPLSVIEAQCLGTPVLGARIGGIPELIEENKSGMTFESRNVEDLMEKIQAMWNVAWDYKTMAHQAQERYNAEMYYHEIIRVYQS